MPVIGPALWNLFLALVPVVLAPRLARSLLRVRRLPTSERVGLCGLLLVWLVFLPNSVYMLADVRHLLFDAYWRNLSAQAVISYTARFQIAVWAFLFLAYGGTGLVLYTLALRPIERAARLEGRTALVMSLSLSVVVSLGVYLGLIYRWNSWDLVHRPGAILASVGATLSRARSVAGIVGFGLFLFVWHRGCSLFLEALRGRWLVTRRAWLARRAPRTARAERDATRA